MSWRDRADPVDGGKSVTDSWRSRATPAEHVDETGAGMAALEHFGDGPLLGYLPHIQAAHDQAGTWINEKLAKVGLLPDDAPEMVDENLRKQGFNIQQPETSYLKGRDENLRRIETEGKEHPVASGLGTGLGIGASALLPAGAIAKEATLGAKALQGLKSGAMLGAIANPGDTEGEISPAQLGDRAKNAAISGTIGGAVPVALSKASDVSKRVFKYLRGKEADLAENAVGATRVQAEDFKPGTGRFLRKQGVVNFGSSPKNIAANANAITDAAEASKGAITKELAHAKVDRNKVYDAIKARIEQLRGDESKIGLIEALEKKADDVLNVGAEHGTEVPIGKAEEIRKGLDKNAKWSSNSDAASLEANKELANIYREAGEGALTKENPTLGAKFKSDKTSQSKLIPVIEAAEKRAAQLKQSPIGGLLDIAAGGAGGAIGGLIGDKEGAGAGTALGLLVKGMRPRYAAMGSAAAAKGARAAAGAASGLSKLNPLVASAIASRMTTTNPEFQKDDSPILNDQRLLDLFKKDPSLMDAIEDEVIKAKVKRKLAGN